MEVIVNQETTVTYQGYVVNLIEIHVNATNYTKYKIYAHVPFEHCKTKACLIANVYSGVPCNHCN